MDAFKQQINVETIKQQCNALQTLGCVSSIVEDSLNKFTPLFVIVRHNDKLYRFSDPDLNIIISQICTLHASIIKQQDHVKTFIQLMGYKLGLKQNRA